MADKLNCWEFHNCGREKGGLLANLLGECPVSTAMKYDGHNDGKAGGRACWMVTGSTCRAKARNAGRGNLCLSCAFYRRVIFEQDEKTVHRFNSTPTL